jgi:type I restriction enzyme, S subunit
MNTAWKKVKIDEVADFINGGAWGENEYTNDGIGVLKVSNLQNSGIDYSNISFLSNESLSKYARHQLKIGDLVIATVGSHPSLVNSSAGRATIIPKQANGYLLNQNAVCLRTKNEEILNQKFLAYTGKTVDFQHFIQQRGKGAANQMRIAIGGIKEFELPLPPLEIQTRIANILSAYDDLIENNLRRIKLLEEMAELTYREWFVNFTIDGKTLEIDKNTGLPFGWEYKELGCLIKFIKGKKANDVSEEYQKGYLKLLLLDSIESGNYKYVAPHNQVITENQSIIMLMDGARSSKVFLVESGVIGSTLAKIQILDSKVDSTLLKSYFDFHFEKNPIE